MGDFVDVLHTFTLPENIEVALDCHLFAGVGIANEIQICTDLIHVFLPYRATTSNTSFQRSGFPFLFDGITFSTGDNFSNVDKPCLVNSLNTNNYTNHY